MEILTYTEQKAKFTVPKSLTTANATFEVDGQVAANSAPVQIASGVASVSVPYNLVTSEKTIVVKLSFTFQGSSHVLEKTLTVATPYLEDWEMQEVMDDEPESERIKVERAVRNIINAHTGQSFGYAEKTLTVRGDGETALRLPERLLKLNGISTQNAVLNPAAAIVVSDGWYLKKGWSEEVTAIDPGAEDYYFGRAEFSGGVFIPEKPGHGAIIKAPQINTVETPWQNDYPFTLDGEWGYRAVPEPVKEAARLLVNDYACQEIIFRDRYLDSIRAADWRLEFNQQAWFHTGNVRADQLLAPYVLMHWAVI